VAHSGQPNSPQWPIAHIQIHRSGPWYTTEFAILAITYNQIRRSGPLHGWTLKVEYHGEFESMFESALDKKNQGTSLVLLVKLHQTKISHAAVLLML
jgi:hypothetical protein